LINWLQGMGFPVATVLMSATMPDFEALGFENLARLDMEPAKCPSKTGTIRHVVYLANDIYSAEFQPNVPAMVRQGMAALKNAFETKGVKKAIVFVDGEHAINEFTASIKSTFPGLSVFAVFGGSSEMEVKKAMESERCVIVATPIVESSVTIPGVDCVVDTLVARESCFMTSTGTDRLETRLIAQSAATQRAGRCARDCREGWVYRLCTEGFFKNMRKHSAPVIFNDDMAPHVLELLSIPNPVNPDSPLPVRELLQLRGEEFDAIMDFLYRIRVIDSAGFADHRADLFTKLVRAGLSIDMADFARKSYESLDNKFELANAIFVTALVAARSAVPVIVNRTANKDLRDQIDTWRAKTARYPRHNIEGMVAIAIEYLRSRNKVEFCAKLGVNHKYFVAFERQLRNIKSILSHGEDILDTEFLRELYAAVTKHTSALNDILFPIAAEVSGVYHDADKKDAYGNSLARYFATEMRDGRIIDAALDKFQMGSAVGAGAIAPLVRSEIQKADGSINTVICFYLTRPKSEGVVAE
jgi:hypothetical protein